jgi:transcription initiation factor IIE alpha subunit
VIAVDESFVPRSTCPVCGEVLVPYDEGIFPQLICERDRLVLVGE